ncbi:MAG: leucine-rich repeat domain-containing protein, partial [Clostridia bacterium]
INGISYVVKNGNAIAASCERSLETVIIPSKVTINNVEYNVTSIGDWAFYNCGSLSIITLPRSVISIGGRAFNSSTIVFTDALTKPDGWSCEADYYGCDLNTFATINGISYVVKNGNAIIAYCVRSIETAIIPSKVTINNVEYNVTSIGNRAFYNCSNLSSVTLPSSVTSIGDSTFYGCHSLSSITLPNSLTTIGNGAFYECSSLSSITLPSSVTSIGDSTFYECYSLSSITLPSSVISIGEEAFYNCSSLRSITLPSSVTSIGDLAFYNCSNLISITLPSGVTSIGDSTFYGCHSLSSITLPNSLTTIGDGAFYECSSLSSITLPSSVISVGWDAFEWSTIVFTDALNSSDGWRIEANYYGCDLNNVATINGISYLVKNGNAIIASCESSLKTVIIPSKVTINNVEYNVTSIGDWAFYNCGSLSIITLPRSVISIGGRAFNSSTIVFTDALTKPDGWSCEADYYGCDLNTFATINGISYVVKNGNAIIASCERSLVTANIPSKVTINNVEYNVTSIGNRAFYGCANLTTITLPRSVTSIGNEAFRDCISLSSITLPSSVTSIGDYAFLNCYNLTIYCEALSQPDSWSVDWNCSNCPVVWGHK